MKHRERAALEAMLFLATQPLPLAELAKRLNVDEETVGRLVAQLEQEYAARESGLEIVPLGGGLRLCTRPELARYLLPPEQPPHLSAASLEVLVIVAYRQPVTRSQIEQIRGVRSERALASLVERDLITEAGRAEGPGRPILYGTTATFLETFGFNTLQELPSLPAQLTSKQDS